MLYNDGSHRKSFAFVVSQKLQKTTTQPPLTHQMLVKAFKKPYTKLLSLSHTHTFSLPLSLSLALSYTKREDSWVYILCTFLSHF